MTSQQKLERFFQQALPVAWLTQPSAAVMWWAYHGELLRVALDPSGDVDVEHIEPDSVSMDELLKHSTPDAICDAIALSHRLMLPNVDK